MNGQYLVVPVRKKVWLVLDEGPSIGPIRCIAIATHVSADDAQETLPEKPSSCLILPKDAGEWDSLWVDHTLVAFSAESAEALRTQRYYDKHPESDTKDLDRQGSASADE